MVNKPIIITRTCKNCGAVYSIQKTKTIERESGEISCEHCGESLLSYNDSYVYYSEEISVQKSIKGI
jgi:transcription elongation factor Elf1